jgi:myo-inositol-1(or 4)-monophosphatase
MDRHTRIAIEAAKASGVVLNRYFLGKATNFRKYKGKNDLVTAADIESCRMIKRQLKKAYPNHNYLFEENEFSEDNGSDYLWIIDPLDGTTFHNRGLPFFSSLITLQIRNQTEMGLAYCSFTDDLFVSWRGKGSFHWNHRFRVRRRLTVSRTKLLDEALIGYSYGKTESHLRHSGVLLKRLLPHCRAFTRVAGSDIGYVASGACDAFVDNSSTPWDFAGIALMVREAGGRVTDFEGREWSLNSKAILASNKLLHKRILELIQSQKPKSELRSRTS